MNIEETFKYHAPTGSQPARYERIREMAREFASFIAGSTPASAEQTLALRALQQSVMWANAAIAINEVKSYVD